MNIITPLLFSYGVGRLKAAGFSFICFILFFSTTLAQDLKAVKSEQGIEVTENGKKILFFQSAPKSLNGKYERAGYVHPLYGLNEKIITEDMPADHPHHHGIFWAWHQILLNGKMVADGWSYENISWKPVAVNWKKEKGAMTIISEMIWNVKTDASVQMPIVKENTRITIFKATDQYRIIDFDIRLKALTEGLKIGGSDNIWGYGGFSVRLNVPDDISFSSDNMPLKPVDSGVFAPWVDFKGSFEGKSLPKNGVAVFPKPLDSDQPVSWTLNAKPSMQNVRYPGRVPVTLSTKGLRLQYRVIIHDEKMPNENLKNLYEQYIGIPGRR